MCQRANATGSWITTMRSSSPPGCFEADLGVTVLDQDPATRSGPRHRGVVEAHHHPAPREAVVIDPERHPSPQHDARMGMFGLQLRPLRSPVVERQHDLRQLASRLGWLVRRTRAVGFGTDLDEPGELEFS
jgi:hypothetical protein